MKTLYKNADEWLASREAQQDWVEWVRAGRGNDDAAHAAWEAAARQNWGENARVPPRREWYDGDAEE